MKCTQNVYWEEYLHLKDSLYTDKKIILVLKLSEYIMMLCTSYCCSLFPLHQVADFSYYTKGTQNFVLIINTFIKNFINFKVYLIGWLYSLIPDWLIIVTHWFLIGWLYLLTDSIKSCLSTVIPTVCIQPSLE